MKFQSDSSGSLTTSTESENDLSSSANGDSYVVINDLIDDILDEVCRRTRPPLPNSMFEINQSDRTSSFQMGGEARYSDMKCLPYEFDYDNFDETMSRDSSDLCNNETSHDDEFSSDEALVKKMKSKSSTTRAKEAFGRNGYVKRKRKRKKSPFDIVMSNAAKKANLAAFKLEEAEKEVEDYVASSELENTNDDLVGMPRIKEEHPMYVEDEFVMMDEKQQKKNEMEGELGKGKRVKRSNKLLQHFECENLKKSGQQENSRKKRNNNTLKFVEVDEEVSFKVDESQ